MHVLNNNINPLLASIGEDVMGFLNEIQIKYPKAISLASGRPDEHYFNVQDFPKYFDIYINTIALSQKIDRRTILNNLGQYNCTKGIICKLVSTYLKKEEKIHTNPEDILITVGTQEALSIAILTLCDRKKDVIVIEDPTYIGITHFSKIGGYFIEPVPVDINGICLKTLEERIIHCKKQGKKVKIVYVIPDYQNPTGSSMPLKNRHRLLALANKYNFFILEDNAYGQFVYQGTKQLTIKALDIYKRVIYIHSFSKILYPSLRLSIMIADQLIKEKKQEIALSDLMAKTKGYVTVNTPSINQAVLGGMLIENNFSFKKVNKPKIVAMKKKRDKVIFVLNKYLNPKKHFWAKDIFWNIPNGGFFITIHVPFKVNKQEVLFCAEEYNIIFTPMAFFYFNEGGDNEIRLAFSNLSEIDIDRAIKKLAMYFKSKIYLLNNKKKSYEN